MKNLVTIFISVLLANMASMVVFFFVATWWVHKVVDVAADRHIATQFNKAVKNQTKTLLGIIKKPTKKVNKSVGITPKLQYLRETTSQPTEKLKRLRGEY